MKYRSDTDFRKALEHRLRERERDQGVPLIRLRKRLVFERCMVRLQKNIDSPWVLKGGFALELRLGNQARMTKDLDLGVDLGVFSKQALTYEDILKKLRQDLSKDGEDPFMFLLQESRDQKPIVAGTKTYHFSMEVRLAGRVFEKIRVDIGLGDPLVTPFDALTGSDLFSFAGIPTPTIRATSRAQHFAEKVHALTFRFNDRINTRVKDLVDIMLLMDMGLPEPKVVKNAVEKVFSTRQKHPIPQIIENPPATWFSSFTAMAIDVGLKETSMDNAVSRLRNYWSKLFS